MNDEQRQHVWTICAGGMQECIEPEEGHAGRCIWALQIVSMQMYSMRNRCTCIMWCYHIKFNGGPGETAGCS